MRKRFSRPPRLLAALLALCLLPALPALGEGFSRDYPAIDQAAQSVLMLTWGDLFYGISGSAFVAFEEDMLLTNYHVLEGVQGEVIAYSDAGERFVIDRIYIGDRDLDLALVGLSKPAGLQPLALGDTSGLYRAEPVVAIGSPKGQKNTVSLGNVSGMFKEDGVRYVQFTAPISSGSSGGALFDDRGQVIGVTSAYLVDAQNMNLAVDISEAKDLYQRIEYKDGLSFRAYWKAEKAAEAERAAAARTPFAERNFSAGGVKLFWCDKGKNISFLSTEKHPFDSLDLAELQDSLDQRDYYAALTFSMDAAEGETQTAMELVLTAPGGGQQRQKQQMRFLAQARQDAVVTSKLTALFSGVKGGGRYTLSYEAEGAEVASASFEVIGAPAPEESAAPEASPAALPGFAGRGPASPRASATPAPGAAPDGALRRGDRGEEVRRMQEALIALDYLEGGADGVFGQETEQALRSFQRINGLTGVFYGRADPKTLALLYSGEALPYADPDVVLSIDPEADARWPQGSEDVMQVLLVNGGRRRTVTGYSLCVRIYDGRDRLESEQVLPFQQELAPGASAYSPLIRLATTRNSSWMELALVSVTYADGATVEVPKPEYQGWWL